MKSILLCLAITAGLFLPGLGEFSSGIRVVVMLMLTQGFLTVVFSKDMLSKELCFVMLANMLIPIPLYLLASLIGERQAEAVFLIAAAPSAVASPIVIGFIRKRTDFVVMAVIITNLLMVLTLPIAIPLVTTPLEAGGEDTRYQIVVSVMVTIALPFFIALILRWVGGRVYRWAVWTKKFSLYIWMLAIILACAKARSFVSSHDVPPDLLYSIAAVSAGVCAVNFGLGYLLGGKKFPRESSQSLGQKNTLFSVWVGLTFFNPVSVVAPVAYIIFQNIYNALQILVFEIAEKRKGVDKPL